MNGLIWLLIAFWVIQKIVSRTREKGGPPGPTGDQRLPGPWGRAPEPEALPEIPAEDDLPLSGPWDRNPDRQDREIAMKTEPVSDIPVPDVNVPADVSGVESRPPGYGQDEYSRDEYSKEGYSKEGYHQEEYRQTGAQEPARAKNTSRPSDDDLSHQGFSGKGAVPLHQLLRSRHGLAASVIVNEVFNRRGGKMRSGR